MDSDKLVKQIRSNADLPVLSSRRSTGHVARTFLGEMDDRTGQTRFEKYLLVLDQIVSDPEKYGAKASIDALKEITTQADIRPSKSSMSKAEAFNKVLNSMSAPARNALIKLITTQDTQSFLIPSEDGEIINTDEEVLNEKDTIP